MSRGFRLKAQARQVLRKLFDQPLLFEAYEEKSQRGFRLTGQGSYVTLLPDQRVTPFVVSPTGLEGFCKPLLSWAVAFEGSVQAA